MSETETFDTLLLERPDTGILIVRLNRPAVANALNTRMAQDLHALFDRIALNATSLRCVILTGAGNKAFCGGADLKERDGMSDAEWHHQHVLFERAFQAVLECPIPVIAAVNGAAYGGGCEIALCSDFIHASDTARFALPEVSRGIMPGGGGTQTLSRAVGERRARELIYSATPFNAKDAHAWGMVNALHAPEDLEAKTLGAARLIAANAPVAVRQVKRAIALGADADLKTAIAIEIEAYNRTVGTADRREGIAAFNEKRPPEFSGE